MIRIDLQLVVTGYDWELLSDVGCSGHNDKWVKQQWRVVMRAYTLKDVDKIEHGDVTK